MSFSEPGPGAGSADWVQYAKRLQQEVEKLEALLRERRSDNDCLMQLAGLK